MSVYSDAQAIFDELAADPDLKQGSLAYVTEEAAAGSTPDAPGTVTVTSYPFNGFARTVSTKYVDGTNIINTDKQLSIPGSLLVVPEVGGFVDIDGSRHKIVRLDPIPAAGTPVTYRTFVRR